MTHPLDIRDELCAYGAQKSEVVILDEQRAELIDYLDLITLRGKQALNGDRCISPNAVLEVDGRPMLYVLQADQLSADQVVQRKELQELSRVLACRGEFVGLAVVYPGEITVYKGAGEARLSRHQTMSKGSSNAKWLIRDLLSGGLAEDSLDLFGEKIPTNQDDEAIYDLLYRLLNEVNRTLLKTAQLKGKLSDVLSLVGRALFTRFLIDRNIINRQSFPDAYVKHAPENLFSTPSAAALTCRWLEENFNGELLPLPVKKAQYSTYFESLDSPSHSVFKALAKILYRTDQYGQQHLDWGFVDFAHVPVGLLSQVYERYSHEHFEKHALDESVHYTPHHIARFVVRQAFEGLSDCPAHEAKILDPAAGTGVFLVLAFRQLIQARWKATGIRPQKAEIREILYTQIRGFDINEHALRLAALSLYLTALELDPDPSPPSALRFEKLQDKVLYPTRMSGEEFPAYPVMGSLGPAVGPEHLRAYDLIIGNPPWTSWEGMAGKALSQKVQEAIRTIARERGSSETLLDIAGTYQHPDNVPDLPFVWKATTWGRPNAVIALILHGRLLFKRGELGAKARDSLFKAVRVTGILNAAGLDATKIWPGINQPFCVLFAKNRLPEPTESFYYISPDRDTGLNGKSFIRIDYQAARPVLPKKIEKEPTLLKVLFRGTELDADLIARLSELTQEEGKKPSRAQRLGDYWTESKKLFKGFGYQIAGRGTDAASLRALKGVNLTKASDDSLLIDVKKLPKFKEAALHRPRKPELYLPPLVVFSKAPGEMEHSTRARLALQPTPVIFNESFIGYSAAGHDAGAELSSYLFLLASSSLYVYYTLMTSSQFGVERRVLHGEDIADFPLVRFENLTSSQVTKASSLALSFAKGATKQAELDKWVNRLYGLDDLDDLVIRDAIDTQMPYASSNLRAEAAPTQKEISAFAQRLSSEMQPFFDFTEEVVKVEAIPNDSATWLFFAIQTNKTERSIGQKFDETQFISEVANWSSSSRIFILQGERQLVLGLRAQYRYFTASRARICAADILRDHAEIFPVGEQ